MARKAIKATDIVAKDVFKNAIKGANTLLDVFKDLKKSIAETGKELEKALVDNKLDSAESIVMANKAVEKLAKTTDEYKKIQEDEIKVKKQKKDLTDEQLKQSLRERKELRDRKKALEAQITLEQTEVKTLKQLREANKALRVERDNLDISSSEGAERIAEINEQIDENNDLIKENVDQLTQQKIGIGNYEEAITGALDKTGLFGDEIAALKDGLNLVASVFRKSEVAANKNTKALTRSQKATQGLGKALKALGKIGILAIVASIAAIAASFQSSQRGALEFQEILATLQAGFTVFIARLTVFARGLTQLFSSIGDGAKTFGKQISVVLLEAQKKFAEFKESASFKGVSLFPDAAKEAEDLTAQIEVLNGEIETLQDTSTLGGAVDTIKSAFTDISKAVDAATKSADAAKKALNLEFNARPRISEIEREIALIEQREVILQETSDSATIGFEAQKKALIELEIEQAKRIAFERELATIQKNIVDEKIRAEIRAKRAQIQEAGFTVKSLENVDALLKVEAVRLELNKDLIDQQQEAFLALQEVRKNEIELDVTNSAVRRQVRQDELERNLDFLIDDFDNRKTINERIIASDKATFDARAKALSDTRVLAEESFAGQVEIIEEFAGKAVDVNALIATSSEQELVARTRALGLSEIVEGRLLEIIRERRIVVQELAEAQQDVFDQGFRQEELLGDLEATNEALNSLSEFDLDNIDISKLSKEGLQALQDDIKKFNEDLEEENEKLAEKRAQNEIDLLRDEIQARIDLGQENSEIVLAQQKDLNDKLLAQQQDRLKKESEAADKAIEEADKKSEKQLERENELRQAAIGAAEAFFEARAEKRLESIDKELEAVQSRQDQLRTIAEQGSQEAIESLALEQRKEAELQVQRERELRQQQRIELGLTALKTFTDKADSGDPQPLQSTFRDLLQLKAFVSAFPGFYEGTDSVGKSDGVNLNTTKDNLLVRVHEGERIMGVKDSKELQGYTNEGIVQLVKAHERGVFSDNIAIAKVASPANNGMSIAAIEKLGDIESVLKGLPSNMPKHTTDYNALEGMITDVVRTGNGVRRTKMRARWR